MDIRATITILILVFTITAITPLSFAGSPNTLQGQILTIEHKKDLARKLGIILKGMTKEEVRNTLGFIKPETWHTPKGQEVWYYSSPESQVIYFTNDTVERIEYTSRKKRPPVKQAEEI